jgi:hypothetical protein
MLCEHSGLVGKVGETTDSHTLYAFGRGESSRGKRNGKHLLPMHLRHNSEPLKEAEENGRRE